MSCATASAVFVIAAFSLMAIASRSSSAVGRFSTRGRLIADGRLINLKLTEGQAIVGAAPQRNRPSNKCSEAIYGLRRASFVLVLRTKLSCRLRDIMVDVRLWKYLSIRSSVIRILRWIKISSSGVKNQYLQAMKT